MNTRELRHKWMARLLGIVVVCCLVVPGLYLADTPSGDDGSVPVIDGQAQILTSPSYPNTNDVVLWVAQNMSDPGEPWPNERSSPQPGMEFFGTKACQLAKYVGVHDSYTWAQLNDSSLFPLDCELWIPIVTWSAALAVAANAVTNPRIVGAWMDDFRVGWESPANMSSIHENLSLNDGILTQGPLQLALVVYNRNYYLDSPNSWASIEPYFDIVQYWFYPDSYGQTYYNFVGWEDTFYDLKSKLPNITFWIGIYLHYYWLGSYPFDFTYRQMSLACRWLLQHDVDKITILGDYWISNNIETSYLVRNFLFNELRGNYSTVWNTTAGTVQSYSDGTALSQPLIDGCSSPWANNYTLTSRHLQNLSMLGMSGTDIRVRCVRTGETYNATMVGSVATFILEPGEQYLVLSQPLTPVTYSTEQIIETPTYWNNKEIWLSAIVRVNSTLYIND